MQTKKSKVTAIQENVRQYEGPSGTIFYHNITFENGDSGQYGSKTEKCTKFTVNTEADYTIEEKQTGQYKNYTIKPVQQSTGGGGGRFQPRDENLIVAQSSLGYACTLLQQSSKAMDTEYVLATAERFYQFVITKKTK